MPTQRLLLVLLCCTALEATVSDTKTDISYDHTAAGTSGELFVAATSPASGKESLSVARAVSGISATTGKQSLSLEGLVPYSAQINGRTYIEKIGTDSIHKKKNDVNPLYNNKIHWFSTYNNMPLVVCGANADSAQTLVNITNLVDGSSIRMNESAVRDADGLVGGTIKAAVGGARVIPSVGPFDPGTNQNVVFAAVTPNGATTFAGQAAAGIAVLYNYRGGLVQVDATGGRSTTPKAVSLPSSLIKMDGEGAITGIASMHWDSTLQRLFIGLTLDTGGITIVVGQLERVALANKEVQGSDERVPSLEGADVKLTLRPIVSLDSWDGTDYYVCEKDSAHYAKHVTTLHTSVNRSFVVFDRGSGEVIALPIVNGSGKHMDNPSIGLLAQKGSHSDVVSSADHLISNAGLNIFLSTPGLSAYTDEVTGLYTYGDGVYATFGTSGVFSARCVFVNDDAPGTWNRWERIAYSTDNIYGFSIDMLGRPQFVTGADADTRDTVHSAVWGLGDNNTLWGGTTSSASTGIVSRINAMFSRDQGGIHAVHCIGYDGDDIPWSHASARLDDSVMLICLGYNRCVVLMTRSDGTITTAANFDADAHLANYNLTDDGLDLGMLTSTALCANSTDGEEWLFVGGEKGFAVRSKTDGEGSGSAITEVTDIGTGFRFKELTKADGSSFSSVRSIHTYGSYVYVLDSVGLYRIAMDSDKFKDTSPDALGETLIASAAVLLGSSEHQILDFAGMGTDGFLCTTAGLWTQKSTDIESIANNVGTGGWTEVFVTPGGTDSFGVCVQALGLPVTARGVLNTPGTIYVLAADTSLNISTVYRLGCESAGLESYPPKQVNHSITGSARYYTTMLGQLRSSIYTEGALLFDLNSTHHVLPNAVNGPLRILPLASSMNEVDAWNASAVPLLETTDGTHTYGRMIRDFATGTLIIPTNSGLRVLQ